MPQEVQKHRPMIIMNCCLSTLPSSETIYFLIMHLSSESQKTSQHPCLCISTEINLWTVSIRKTVLPGMAIPMLKIRRPNGRLIFNMEIAIRRYDGLYIETGPWCLHCEGKYIALMHSLNDRYIAVTSQQYSKCITVFYVFYVCIVSWYRPLLHN